MTTKLNDEGSGISRRAVIGAAGAALAASLAGAANAQSHNHDHSAHGDGAQSSVLQSALSCVNTGEVCLAHCHELMGAGDTSMKDCATSVSSMLAISQALTRLSASNSKRLKLFALVAVDFYSDCEAECRKHAEKHSQCKACMDACTAMIGEIRKLIA